MLNTWIFFSICLVLVLGQLLRFEPLPGIPIYPHDILIGIFLIINFKVIVNRIKSKWLKSNFYTKHRRIIWLLAWLGLTGLLKLLISGQPTYLLYLSRFVFYGSLLLVINQLTQRKLPRVIQKPLTANVIIFAQHLPFFFTLVSLFMFIIQPDMRFFRSLGWDDHYYRLTGPLLDPNYTGIILAIGALVALAKSFFSPFITTQLKILQFFELGILLISLTLTYSRSSWLAFVVGVMIFLIMLRKHTQLNLYKLPMIVILVAVLMLSTYTLAPKPGGEGVNITRVYSIESRQQFDQQWLASETIDPLSILFGPSQTPKSATHAKLPNNIFVTIFAWSGPIGVLLFLVILIELFDKARRTPILFGSLVALLVFAQFNSITEPFVILIIGVLVIIEKNTFSKIRV